MKTIIPLFFILFQIGQIASSQDDCNYSSKGNNMIPDKLCAPVTSDWSVSYGGVTYAGPGAIQIYFDWDDGTAPAIVNATFNGSQWVASQTHVYPKGGYKCNYQPSTMLVVNGTICTSSIQTQVVTVWDEDDKNGGILNVSPLVYPICYGSSGATYFNDNSQWNCVPPIELDYRNNFKRWTQWIYGTGGTNITNAIVGGSSRTYPYTGAIIETTQPIEGPVPPNDQSLFIEIPTGHAVGKYFEVTLRNWNYCNPYDDPNIPGPPADPINGDNAPIITTAMALIVALPDGTITAAGPFCENDGQVILSAATPGGTWSGTGISNAAPGAFRPVNAGPGLHSITYNITDPNGCSAAGTTQIRVWEAPDITLSVSNPLFLCPGVAQPILATVTNGAPAYDVEWLGDIGPLSSPNVFNPDFETTTPGIYDLEFIAIDQNDCQSIAPLTIEVNEVTVEFNPPVLEVCQFTPLTLEPIPSGGSRNYIKHEWLGPHTAKLSQTNVINPNMNTDESGTFTFTYRVTDDQGCSDEASISITVKEQPSANAGSDGSTCTLSYTLDGNNWPGASSVWTVESGPGNISFSDANAFDATTTADTFGPYQLKWEVDLNGCLAIDIVEIIFSPLPDPQVIPNFSICGLSAQIEAIPDGPGGSWLLSSGPGLAIFADNSQPITNVEVDQPGTYLFTWQEAAGPGCDGTATLEVIFKPQAIAIVDPIPAVGCTPYEVTFPNGSLYADNYQWNLGGGLTSTETNPTHIYENYTSGIRTIEITLQALNSGGCNDSFVFNIEVAPNTRAATVADPPAGCSPFETKLINNSTGATKYRWDFNDASPVSNEFEPTHTFANDGNFVVSYEVKLVTENNFGCMDSVKTYVTVYPSAPLSIDPLDGCNPLTTTLSTRPGASSYFWDFGDGTSETSDYITTHTYHNTTDQEMVYAVKLVATSPFNCTTTTNGEVSVFPSPNVDFSVTPAELAMPNRTVTLNNQTTGNNWTYFWNFGDGTTSDVQNPGTHQYEGSGTYTIELTATSGRCSDVKTQQVVILPMVPIANIEVDPSSGCPPLTVNFSNYTVGATQYLWEFGDGGLSQEIAPSHTYLVSGSFKVKLTATGPGGIDIFDEVTIVVFEKPFAQFEVVPKILYLPAKPIFINKSVGATIYEWNFGDGYTSTEFSPSHLYQDPGLYTISLNVENNFGCTDQSTVNEAIKVEPGGEIKFPNAFTPSPSGPSSGQYTYGDPTNHVFYPFTQKGVVEYQLQIFTRWGELIFESDKIEIGWDGYLKGMLAPQGVYIWRAKYKTADGKLEIKAGDVTLIR